MIVVFGMLKLSSYHILLSDVFCVSVFLLFFPFTPFYHPCEQYIYIGFCDPSLKNVTGYDSTNGKLCVNQILENLKTLIVVSWLVINI